MKKKGVIDRFEGEWAIVEMDDGQFIDIPMETLPPDAKEGNVIYIDEDGRISILAEETLERRKRVQDLMDKLFQD
ncbi:MAG: DUF3006 domain-containing protein [Clostridiales bacterium]|nr:DUF3006 domain-containing protein [Clostridiales bacterium]